MKDRDARWEDITPERATELLTMNTCNRTVKQKTVAKYTEDMKTGNWKSNGVPIVIGDDGVIKDGQHRLMAIVRSGVTLRNQLIVTIPKEEANAYDIGTTRTFADVALFEGYADNPAFRNNTLFSAFNFARYNNSESANRSPSKVETLHEMVKYMDELTWVYQHVCSTVTARITSAGVVAAVLNAYLCGYPEDKLSRFCEVLIRGNSMCPEEVTIVTLRNYLLTSERRSGRLHIVNLYYRTQKALHNFDKGVIVTKSVPCQTEYYKFPHKEDKR
jgi:hypothetical protein